MASTNRNLVIVGASGFGREVAWVARECGRNVAGWLDDATHEREICGAPVLGSVSRWQDYAAHEFVIAIGSPRTRRKVAHLMNEQGRPTFATLVHPAAKMSVYVQFGAGTVITAGCVLTTQIVIGEHCILNLNSTVGHDCKFGDFVTVAPICPISGNVILEDGVEVGTGTAIRQGVRMEKGSMAAMGATVVKDVAANALVLGSPARPSKELPPW